jgi:hypothetical protein
MAQVEYLGVEELILYYMCIINTNNLSEDFYDQEILHL